MSRTLATAFSVEKNRVDSAPFNTAVFHFGGSVGDIYVADRDITIGGNAHYGIVSSWGEYQSVVSPRDGVFSLGKMTIELINFPIFGAPAKRFTDLWSGLGVEGIEVDVYQCVRQESQDAVLQDLLFAGVMRPLSYQPSSCQVEIYSVSEKYLDRAEVSFAIDQTDYPNADPDDIGKRANVIYGSVTKAKAHKVLVGLKSTVRSTMAAGATAITIHDDFYDALPSTGSVIIGNETKAYTAKAGSAGARTLTCTATADSHNKDDTIIQVVTSWVFQAAGHAMKSIDKVYVRRGDKIIPLAAAQYTVNLANTTLVSGKTLTTITFTSPPLIAQKDQVTFSSSGSETTQQDFASDETLTFTDPDLSAGEHEDKTIAAPTQSKTKSSGNFAAQVTVTKVSGSSGQGIWVTQGSGNFGVQVYEGSTQIQSSVLFVHASTPWSLKLQRGDPSAGLSGMSNGVFNVSAKSLSYSASVSGGSLTSTSTADNPIGEVYFDGQGYADDGSGTYTGSASALIEKAADVMHHFARVVAGIPSGRVDAASFATARTDAPASYKFAAVLSERSNIKQILLAMGAQCRTQVDWPADKLTARFLKTSYGAITKTLTQEHVMRDGSNHTTLAIERGDVEDLINVVNIYYGRDWSMGRGRDAFTKVSKTTDSGSITKYGRREQADRFLCDFIDTANGTMADDLRDFEIARMKEPPRLIILDAKLDQYEIQPGDIIGLDFKTRLDYPQDTFDGLNGTQKFLVEQVSLKPGGKGQRGTRVGLRLREVA